jgi:4-hydroxyproline epimerase
MPVDLASTVHVVDSHTGGEPTRVVVEGGPPLGEGPLPERLHRFRSSFDEFRSAVVNEPRGNDAMVGALLCEPHDPTCTAGVIFFNNVGYLGMCGHGAIGVMVTLAHLGRIGEGRHRLETPVGVVSAQLNADGTVTIINVPSYRLAKAVTLDVPGIGQVVGDVAWGGNWFFLVEGSPAPLELTHLEALTDHTWRIRQALTAQSITGVEGAEIDHVELFGPPRDASADSRNFVLCPGKAYDRSPCGTGTSAKLACLWADGKLREGQPWRQESIVGSVFVGRMAMHEGVLAPHITGSAFVNAEARLLFDARDPFRMGIRH